MFSLIKIERIATCALCIALAGCGTAEPVMYSGIASSSQLAPNPKDTSGRVPFTYSTQVDWRAYDRMIIEPVTIYRGQDNQFGTMSEADKAELAAYLQTQFAEKLGSRFMLVTTSGPKTLRLKVTLTGATANTPVLSTLSRFDIAGGVYNGVQTVRDKEGTLTGAVIYAVEIHDAATHRLLSAYVSKQYPSPLNIAASVGPLAASKAGIDKGAEALVTQLQ